MVTISDGQPMIYDASNLNELITDGVRLREILSVLNAYLKDKHGCVVGNRHGYSCAVMDMRHASRGTILFKHVSLATCIEFALKQEL